MATDSRHMIPLLFVSMALSFLLTACVKVDAQNARFVEYDLDIYERPDLPIPDTLTTFPDGLMELWLRALERPDAELTRLIIDSIALAHQRGLDGTHTAIPRLIQLAGQPDLTADIARAIAATLIELDVQDQGETLAALAVKHGSPVGRLVEPALIRWNSSAMDSAWLARLEAATDTESSLVLAIEGLGKRRVSAAADRLRSIAQDTGQSISMRLAAARALGRIESSGNVELARRLSDATTQPRELGPLIAIGILASHTDPAAVELLKEFAIHPRTAVQSYALEQLLEVDYRMVDELATDRLDCPDVNVRRWFAKAFFEKRDPERFALHCRMLDDQNPSLRREVARDLITLAKDDDLRQTVIDETNKILNGENWRGCEQACVVMTMLEHRPAGERMVELLDHDRVDVQVAAAWGLMKLQIEELLPDMLEHSRRVFRMFDANELNDDIKPHASVHLAYVFSSFGNHGYREASDLLTRYIPKRFELGIQSRPAAIWALGLIHQGEPREDLIGRLIDRLNDNGGRFPEDTNVTRMAAISLGRVKANTPAALESLRLNAKFGSGAAKWAIWQITGEQPETLEPFYKVVDDWILSPTD